MFLSSPFFFFPLCFTPPHTYSFYLIHPQPHLLTFNHFLVFIVLSFCYFFSSSPSPFFNCSLFISLSKTQASVPLSPTKTTPLGPPPHLYQPLVHGFFFFFFFWFKGKNCRRNHFGRGFCQCLLFFFFFLVVVGLMSVGVVGFVINVVVEVVVVGVAVVGVGSAATWFDSMG